MTFAAPAIAALQERTAYEAWLLEDVYRITDQPIPVTHVDELVYPASGEAPTLTVNVSAHDCIGDWRPGFLKAGAPLILVTAFKLIDMVVEWVLAHNGPTSTHRFDQKIRALRADVVFPPLVASRPWLQERLVSLYTELAPLRGTIIHDRNFTTTDGALTVTNTKAGIPQTPIPVTAEDLRTLSAVAVSLVRLLEGAWPVDTYRERWLRFWLDQLGRLHGEPSLGQLEPGFLNVRQYLLRRPLVEIDLARTRSDVAAKRPHQDLLFALHLVVVELDGSSAQAYLVPWARYENAPSPLRLTEAELGAMTCPLPAGIDIAEVARSLGSA